MLNAASFKIIRPDNAVDNWQSNSPCELTPAKKHKINKGKILAFMDSNPGVSIKEIVTGSGISSATVSKLLLKLKGVNGVSVEYIGGKGTRGSYKYTLVKGV